MRRRLKEKQNEIERDSESLDGMTQQEISGLSWARHVSQLLQSETEGTSHNPIFPQGITN
jgi:hypothetical protein